MPFESDQEFPPLFENTFCILGIFNVSIIRCLLFNRETGKTAAQERKAIADPDRQNPPVRIGGGQGLPSFARLQKVGKD